MSGPMQRWRCPKCGREFGRSGQSHACRPGLTLAEYFAESQPWERPIFDRVARHLESLGDVIVDPVDAGIWFKAGPTFVSLRPMKRWTALGFSLGRKLESPRLSRKVVGHAGRFYHVINVDDPALIDDEILDWLAEAYATATGQLARFEPGAAADQDSWDRSAGGDPMVPDDVDDPFA